MNRLEHWVLRVADSDRTWYGFNWMRPPKQSRVSLSYVLCSSFLLGLPGLLLGAAAIYVGLGTVQPKVWGMLLALAMLVELPLHLLFAHYWNRRADRLAASSHTA
jgi:hypothetical protein